MRKKRGDRWLGFGEERLKKLLTNAGLEKIKLTVVARRTGDPLTVLIASGAKPHSKKKHV